MFVAVGECSPAAAIPTTRLRRYEILAIGDSRSTIWRRTLDEFSTALTNPSDDANFRR
jgi:hypothetical protein